MAIQDELGKMVGPLPLGAWVAVIGGGLGFALYSRKQNADTASDEEVEPEVYQGQGETSGVFTGGTGGAAEDTDGTITSPYEDQDSWGSNAIRVLIAIGCDPVVAQQAISAYLSGAKMSVQQHSLVSSAMVKIGAPPQLPDNYDATPTALPKPVTVTKWKYYVVTNSKTTLGDVARKYKTTWQALWNVNRNTVMRPDNKPGPLATHSGKLPKGVQILIP